MPTISKDNACITIINVFTVDPKNQVQLVKLLGRDAKVNRLTKSTRTEVGEATRAGRRPQAIGAHPVRGTDPAGEFWSKPGQRD